jgi:hypothetical protein
VLKLEDWVAVAVDRFGDPLNPAESGVPGGGDRGQLGDSSGEQTIPSWSARLELRTGTRPSSGGLTAFEAFLLSGWVGP